MTQKILLTLSLVLGAASLAASFAPPALACGGGYGAPDPDTVAVRQTVARYARRHVGAYTRNWVHSVRVEGDRATAIVHIELGEGRAVERDVRLVRRAAAGWRVAGIGPRREVG